MDPHASHLIRPVTDIHIILNLQDVNSQLCVINFLEIATLYLYLQYIYTIVSYYLLFIYELRNVKSELWVYILQMRYKLAFFPQNCKFTSHNFIMIYLKFISCNCELLIEKCKSRCQRKKVKITRCKLIIVNLYLMIVLQTCSSDFFCNCKLLIVKCKFWEKVNL